MMGRRWHPRFAKDSSSLLVRATACLGLWQSFPPFHSEMTCRFQKIKAERMRGNAKGLCVYPPKKEIQTFHNLNGKWLQLTHLPTCFSLNYWKVFLFLCVLKFSSPMYIFYVFILNEGKKKKKKKKNSPKIAYQRAEPPVLGDRCMFMRKASMQFSKPAGSLWVKACGLHTNHSIFSKSLIRAPDCLTPWASLSCSVPVRPGSMSIEAMRGRSHQVFQWLLL